jgi:DNA polymerase-4
MARVLFHVDLNAFYASAEELRHPEYKGKPLAVGSLSNRGVVSTCNYAARELGIHSAMPTAAAKEICPDLIIVPGDYAYYKELSRKFFALLRRYAPAMEIVSIDECYLDVTDVIKRFSRPLDLAVAMQQAVKKELGLSCSIGVAPTRFLAKMASDMHKPMGLTVLRKSEIQSKVYPLPLSKCIGIGVKRARKLTDAGLETIADVMDPENEEICRQVLRSAYDKIKLACSGKSSDKLQFSTTRKTISHSRTFSHDLMTLEEVLEQAKQISIELSASMKKAGRQGAQISVVMRDREFNNQVRSLRLRAATDRAEIIYAAASALLTENFDSCGYRLIGITMGSLVQEEQIVLQPTLFDEIPATGRDVVNALNRQFEGYGLMTAADLLKKKKPEEKENTDKNKEAETKEAETQESNHD